jgi:YVTN family beta-propeller protein
MKRNNSFCPSSTVVFVLALLVVKAGSIGAADLSPSAITSNKSGSRIYVAETGSSQVAVVDIEKSLIEKRIQLPQAPIGLVLGKDETQLFVTGDGPKGTLMTVNLDKGQIEYSLRLGHTPMSPVLSPDGGFVYLCNRFDNCVIVVDLKQKSVLNRIPVKREPIACGLSPDGKFLFVANLLPKGPANSNDIAAEVEVIDTSSLSVVKSVRLPNGSTSLRGLCISPDGKHVFVTHILARYTMPTTQLERGWMNTNALSVIDAEKKCLINTILLDDINLGAANPWGIVCSPDGSKLFVTHAGTHEVSVIDLNGLLEKLGKVAQGNDGKTDLKVEDVPNTLAFLGTLRKRVRLNVIGPRVCTFSGSSLVVTGFFSDSLDVLTMAEDGNVGVRTIPLNSEGKMSHVRRGEMLFNDARLCFQQWQSCASCHPDARADGLNWDLLNDGLGNPKSTKSMLLSHVTPPVMISGIRQDAEMAVRSGIKYIQFTIRPEEDAKDIDTYLSSLKPIDNPFKGNEAIQRGKILFEKAECARCHSGQHFTDLKQYNVGTGIGREAQIEFDTPTLVEIWRTAPYLYDGRAATLEDVIGKYNSEDKHGKTRHLTDQERSNLVAYLLSL